MMTILHDGDIAFLIEDVVMAPPLIPGQLQLFQNRKIAEIVPCNVFPRPQSIAIHFYFLAFQVLP
jgi:hypothetical protein